MPRTTDRIKSGWAALVRHLLPPTIDLYAYYPAKVVGQSGDWKQVDVQPDDQRLPGMTQLPLMLPPGYRAQLNVGAAPRVMIGWKGGDPSQPFATPAWDPGAATLSVELRAQAITINPTGAQPAARKGDGVKVTIPINALTLAVSGGSAQGPAAPLEVTGTIQAGSGSVSIGEP